MAHNQRLFDNQIKGDAINEAHSTNRRNASKTVFGKTEENRPTGRPRCRTENDIKMELLAIK